MYFAARLAVVRASLALAVHATVVDDSCPETILSLIDAAFAVASHLGRRWKAV
jgi:hypothetical protein